MSVKYFNFRVPHGMALQPYADGSYNLLYDEKLTVQLRDFFAGLTNTLTDTAVKYLEDQKQAEKKLHEERAERARVAAFPISKAAGIEKEKQRINTHVAPMGNTDELPTGDVLDKPRTLVPKKPLVPPKPNRVVLTTQGPLEVAPDVSDDDVRGLGYTLTGDIQSMNGGDDTSNTHVEHSDSPVEDSP